MTDPSADIVPLMTVLTELFDPRDAPGGLSEAVLNAGALRMGEGISLRPGQRVSGNTNEPMPSPPLPPRDSHELVGCDGFRALAGGREGRVGAGRDSD